MRNRIFLYSIFRAFLSVYVMGSLVSGNQERQDASLDMVDPEPFCLTELGAGYCPTPSPWENTTDLYMSWTERSHQWILNAARLSPVKFRDLWMPSNSSRPLLYACRVPREGRIGTLRYHTRFQQAAKQFSTMLNSTGCAFSHDSCQPFCRDLYSNRCDWNSRIQMYLAPSDKTQKRAENAAMSTVSPWDAFRHLAASAGHCKNMFDPRLNVIGIGNTGRFWVQDFAGMTINTTRVSPLVDGTHFWKDGLPFPNASSFRNDSLVFVANMVPPGRNTEVPSVGVQLFPIVVDASNSTTTPVEFPMTMWHGNAQGVGTFGAIVHLRETGLLAESSPLCVGYRFVYRRGNETSTERSLPQQGLFLTQGRQGCASNYLLL